VRSQEKRLDAVTVLEIDFVEKCSGENGFSGRRTAVEADKETAARQPLDGLRPHVLDRLAGDVEGDESNDLDGLMCRDAKRAARVNVPGRVAVHHLHNPNHQNQRNADNSKQRNPGGTRAQLG